MTFSSEVKAELASCVDKARHCRLAELAAIIGQSGRYDVQPDGEVILSVESENLLIASTAETLIREAFGIAPEVAVLASKDWRGLSGAVVLNDPADVRRVLRGTKYMLENGVLLELRLPADGRVVQAECCRKAYLRGLFLCSGSISHPEKSYHFEITCEDPGRAAQAAELFMSFDIRAKTTVRKGLHVVYIKESEQIGDALRIIGAPRSLLKFENTRVLRSVKGDVNRQVNCETANLAKSVAASFEQVEDILLIDEKIGLANLPDTLREAAAARLENSDVSLAELGKMMDPPVGKSGMNHRFRRLRALAQSLEH